MAQSRVVDATASRANDERMSKSLSALDICCHGTSMYFFCPLLDSETVAVLLLVDKIVCHISEANRRRAQLVLGWLTICRWVNRLSMKPATRVNSVWPSLCG